MKAIYWVLLLVIFTGCATSINHAQIRENAAARCVDIRASLIAAGHEIIDTPEAMQQCIAIESEAAYQSIQANQAAQAEYKSAVGLMLMQNSINQMGNSFNRGYQRPTRCSTMTNGRTWNCY